MQTNVELIKKFYNALKAQKKEDYLPLCDDNLEWTTMKNVPQGGTYVGKKAVFEEYFPKLFSSFNEFSPIPEEFLDAREKVVVLGKYQLVSKTGRNSESPFAHIYTIRNGKIIKFRQYADTVEIQGVLN